jgi:apolipoprotein N-acyltransferase
VTLAPHAPAPAGGRAALARRLLTLTVAPLGGLLLYAASAPRTFWWLAIPAFALLGLALHGRAGRGALAAGLLFGLGYYVPLLPWIGIYVGPLPWLALAGFQAVLVGLGALLIARVAPLPAGPVWAAAGWTATEALASRVPFGGFPWGRVAFTQADGPFLRLAALGGPPLVGFAVVLTGFGLTALVLARTRAPGRRPGRRAVTVGVVCALLLALAWPRALTGADDPADGPRTTVAAVQGNVPRLGLDFNAQRRAVLDNHVRRTWELADDVAAGRVPRPALVVWPENASDIDPLRNPDAAAAITGAAGRVGVPILVGAVLVLPDGRHTANSLLVWQPGVGPTQRNDKRRVQPFGEYLPWRGFFRLFSSYADRAGFFVPGTGPGVVSAAGITVGVAICWEVAFDDLVEQSVRNGAELLAVPTNNATFGLSEMTYQQLAMSRVRAVEHDRAVVVAATSGVSAIIAPDGTEARSSGQFVPAALVADVALRRTTTLATRLGSGPEWVLVALAVGALAWALRRRPRTSALPTPPERIREDDEDD